MPAQPGACPGRKKRIAGHGPGNPGPAPATSEIRAAIDAGKTAAQIRASKTATAISASKTAAQSEAARDHACGAAALAQAGVCVATPS